MLLLDVVTVCVAGACCFVPLEVFMRMPLYNRSIQSKQLLPWRCRLKASLARLRKFLVYSPSFCIFSFFRSVWYVCSIHICLAVIERMHEPLQAMRVFLRIFCSFKQGDVICVKGAPGDCMYVFCRAISCAFVNFMTTDFLRLICFKSCMQVLAQQGQMWREAWCWQCVFIEGGKFYLRFVNCRKSKIYLIPRIYI